MNLQQLRYLCQVTDSNFSVTAAAQVLHTSQSGISHQVRELERELGVEIFLRQEKRLLGLTDAGKVIAQEARDVLSRIGQLKAIAADFGESDIGQLTIATTHLHARYALLSAVARFSRAHPSTELRLIQTSPQEIHQLIETDQADLGLTSETAWGGDRFDLWPTYPLGRCVITPEGHPLLDIGSPALPDVARYPLISFDARLSSGSMVKEAFGRLGIVPNIVLSAIDVDVIKAYVSAGLGVAIVPSLAYDAQHDPALRAVSMDHIFPSVMTYVVARRGKYLRKHARSFIDLMARR